MSGHQLERFGVENDETAVGDKVGDAWSLFEVIATTAPPEFRQRASESIISKRLPRFQGTIATLKATMAFIKTSGYVADIFAHASSTKPENWRNLRVGDAVSFYIRFSRNGPTAFDIIHTTG
jgi:cold shock CspA family protein